jgi:hypothetical protein
MNSGEADIDFEEAQADAIERHKDREHSKHNQIWRQEEVCCQRFAALSACWTRTARGILRLFDG